MTFADITSFVVPKRQYSVLWTLFVAALIACEILSVVVVVLIVGNLYFNIFLSVKPSFSALVALGVVTAALYLFVSALRGDYQFVSLSAKSKSTERMFNSWSVAVACLLFLLFMTKSNYDHSRSALIISYFVGLIALGILRRLAAKSALSLAGAGKIAARRMMLVGTHERIASLSKSHRVHQSGIQIVGSWVVNAAGDGELKEQLNSAVDLGRRCRPDEILLLLDWNEKKLIQECLSSLLVLPASINLGSESFGFPVPGYQSTKLNQWLTVPLVREPLRGSEIVVKRIFDLVIAGAGVVMLLPVFAAVAIAIRLESPGPVLFRQKRYGFNKDTFHIYKFRSMYATSGDVKFKQAVANDGRITRVGKYLRKLNLDELPQLINVLRGEMSLVGPRPHPIDLDHQFSQRIALYARRHNVLPGITGWAQINSFRGVTDEEWKMEGRLLHDLYYLDNWSVWFDLKILILTFLAPKAFSNAA